MRETQERQQCLLLCIERAESIRLDDLISFMTQYAVRHLYPLISSSGQLLKIKQTQMFKLGLTQENLIGGLELLVSHVWDNILIWRMVIIESSAPSYFSKLKSKAMKKITGTKLQWHAHSGSEFCWVAILWSASGDWGTNHNMWHTTHMPYHTITNDTLQTQHTSQDQGVYQIAWSPPKGNFLQPSARAKRGILEAFARAEWLLHSNKLEKIGGWGSSPSPWTFWEL